MSDAEPSFHHEPFLDLTAASVISAMRGAIEAERRKFGNTLPLRFGAKEVANRRDFSSRNPSNQDEVVAYHSSATAMEVTAAVREARRAFEDWRRLRAEDRAGFLRALADLILADRERLAALLVVEVGKPWREALGEVTAACDLARWYARDSLRRAEPRALMAPPGEVTAYRYLPLGVGVVIAPWNFPLFLTLGMVAAAIAPGNTVIVKPSSLAPTMGWLLAEMCERIGLPPGVVTCLTGAGGDVGKRLVAHPSMTFVAFTGSRDVGLQIARSASVVRRGQKHIKRVILELGGKNAVVVDHTADMQLAAAETAASAFGYSGQKCAAASRLVLTKGVREQLLSLLFERADALRVGDPADPKTDIGPLIEPGAVHRLNAAIAKAKAAGATLLWRSSQPNPDRRLFVVPTLIGNVTPRTQIAQDELFGPLLAVLDAADGPAAFAIANATAYGLTGSVFSRDPEFLDLAVQSLHVGNLYVNRGCTGARVGCHPFGGFGLSGTDSKTTGPDYLLNFLQAQSLGIRSGSQVSV